MPRRATNTPILSTKCQWTRVLLLVRSFLLELDSFHPRLNKPRTLLVPSHLRLALCRLRFSILWFGLQPLVPRLPIRLDLRFLGVALRPPRILKRATRSLRRKRHPFAILAAPLTLPPRQPKACLLRTINEHKPPCSPDRLTLRLGRRLIMVLRLPPKFNQLHPLRCLLSLQLL
jgi:hypothetical protein